MLEIERIEKYLVALSTMAGALRHSVGAVRLALRDAEELRKDLTDLHKHLQSIALIPTSQDVVVAPEGTPFERTFTGTYIMRQRG